MTKHGLEWFAKLLFVEDIPNKRDQIDQELENNDLFCANIVRRSNLIKDLDFDNKDQAEEIFQRFYASQATIDWWAFLFGTFNAIVEDAIKENDARKAA